MMDFDENVYLDEIREAFADDCGTRLAEHIRSTRFPFTYHHDMVRTIVGPYISRATVAEALEDRYGRGKAYIDAACRGALSYIVREYVSDMLADIRDLDDGELESDKMEIYASILAQASKFNPDEWIDYFSETEE